MKRRAETLLGQPVDYLLRPIGAVIRRDDDLIESDQTLIGEPLDKVGSFVLHCRN